MGLCGGWQVNVGASGFTVGCYLSWSCGAKYFSVMVAGERYEEYSPGAWVSGLAFSALELYSECIQVSNKLG